MFLDFGIGLDHNCDPHKCLAHEHIDWNRTGITCLILLLNKEATHYADDQVSRLCVVEYYKMLAIRLYISALTLLFLLLVIVDRSLGILAAIVITCSVVYLILDVRTDLQSRKAELRLLKELEERISLLPR